jgi:hypothetical protein
LIIKKIDFRQRISAKFLVNLGFVIAPQTIRSVVATGACPSGLDKMFQVFHNEEAICGES